MKNACFSLPLLFALSLLFLIAACNEDSLKPKDAQNQMTRLQIRLTDAPASYEEVNIELKQVLIKMQADTGWRELATYAGIYDLLSLTGGVDTLIVNDSVPAGQIQMLRLVLGDSNYVVIGGANYPLQTPSAQQSGLKLNLNQILVQDSLNDVLIDFDADKSVVKQGNSGGYLLKPVLRVVD